MTPLRHPRALLATALAVVVPAVVVLALGSGPGTASPDGSGGGAGAGSGQRAAACVSRPVATDTREAAAVFTGTVLSTTATPLTDGRNGQSFSQVVEVTTVYNGRLSSSQVVVVTDRVRRQCSLGALAVGTPYVFFVKGSDDAWQALGGAGTAPADDTLVAQVVRLLGDGRSPVAPERESATFTDSDVGAPARLSRVAAPGGALVILGVLGLIGLAVAARRGRRTPL